MSPLDDTTLVAEDMLSVLISSDSIFLVDTQGGSRFVPMRHEKYIEDLDLGWHSEGFSSQLRDGLEKILIGKENRPAQVFLGDVPHEVTATPMQDPIFDLDIALTDDLEDILQPYFASSRSTVLNAALYEVVASEGIATSSIVYYKKGRIIYVVGIDRDRKMLCSNHFMADTSLDLLYIKKLFSLQKEEKEEVVSTHALYLGGDFEVDARAYKLMEELSTLHGGTEVKKMSQIVADGHMLYPLIGAK